MSKLLPFRAAMLAWRTLLQFCHCIVAWAFLLLVMETRILSADDAFSVKGNTVKSKIAIQA